MYYYRRIRDLREDHDLRQKEIAAELNIDQRVYSNYELGKREIPLHLLIKLADYYNVSVDYILELSDNMKRS
ncbi:MAG: helix-turn-helix transcriptional regulator [Eubacterium sp.]|nr:helix-turn-helix transcriptional regulator [Eubacterium sp.]